jgi:hypothetical protein
MLKSMYSEMSLQNRSVILINVFTETCCKEHTQRVHLLLTTTTDVYEILSEKGLSCEHGIDLSSSVKCREFLA